MKALASSFAYAGVEAVACHSRTRERCWTVGLLLDAGGHGESQQGVVRGRATCSRRSPLTDPRQPLSLDGSSAVQRCASLTRA
jgi:hypothetical protein